MVILTDEEVKVRYKMTDDARQEARRINLEFAVYPDAFTKAEHVLAVQVIQRLEALADEIDCTGIPD